MGRLSSNITYCSLVSHLISHFSSLRNLSYFGTSFSMLRKFYKVQKSKNKLLKKGAIRAQDVAF